MVSPPRIQGKRWLTLPHFTLLLDARIAQQTLHLPFMSLYVTAHVVGLGHNAARP